VPTPVIELLEARGYEPIIEEKVDKPRESDDAPIRFLDHDELEAVLRAVPNTALGLSDGAFYMTAAMTGLRRGELLALRWRDDPSLRSLIAEPKLGTKSQPECGVESLDIRRGRTSVALHGRNR
jgi:integrase